VIRSKKGVSEEKREREREREAAKKGGLSEEKREAYDGCGCQNSFAVSDPKQELFS
jgi:hypothetical protein